MATANRPHYRQRSPWLKALLLVLLVAGLAWWYFRPTMQAYAGAATGYGARTACACHYLAGRDLASCGTDFLPGMWMVRLSADTEKQSLTASVPLVASNTALYRQGFGCVMEPWEN